MSIVPDKLYHLGGIAVGGSGARDFEGWWGGNTFFVDYDNGTTGVRGDEMDRPQKHLRIAINNAGRDDTIYVRPRAFSTGTYGEDPQQITPDTAANFQVSKEKESLSIIGTGKGAGHAAAHKTWIGTYSGQTGAVLTLYAPGCVVENLRAQPGSSTSGIIYSINNATYDGGNQTIINNDFHDGTSSCPALKFNATWQMEIAYNRFLNCDIGLYWDATYSEPTIIQVHDNKFLITAAEAKCDNQTSGGVKRFFAYNNIHAAAQPTGGSPNKYYSFAAASTGAIMNCTFGAMDTTDTNLFTLNGVIQSGNYSSEGLVITS